MTDGGPRYERPPVRGTTLTVFFEPVENFDLSIINKLVQRWAERFPALQQSPPSPRPSGLPSVNFFSGAGWPLPSVEQVASSLSRSISYQHDQFSLAWSFDPEAPDSSYPGFENLSVELSTYFQHFADVIERLGDTPLKVQGCRCFYVNRFEDIEGVDWLANALSGWEGVAAKERYSRADYIGFRLRKTTENPVLGTRRTALSELDSGADTPTTQLDIDVVSLPLPQSKINTMGPTEAARILLNDAHTVLIETFQTSADNAMRASWGVQP
ncbi:TIGR04255 family protein [Mycobacterium sp. AT1]|uniref:TIGR04255 family protein n=1 Tax=Mycobacterium sp. AT1 TaxID=1961706 RepID=UPI0009D243D1|nr:TIGR04255 family protein [Mycobacterium sp. AT1]OPX05950.1 hypothetical protein B1790_29620 [Mycobacterium sp. AT1]